METLLHTAEEHILTASPCQLLQAVELVTVVTADLAAAEWAMATRLVNQAVAVATLVALVRVTQPQVQSVVVVDHSLLQQLQALQHQLDNMTVYHHSTATLLQTFQATTLVKVQSR